MNHKNYTMRKIFTSVFAILFIVAINAQTQIGNSGFENWETIPGGSEPVNWNSFLTAGGGLSNLAQNQIEESSDVRPGSTGTKSIRIFSNKIVGIIANGNITLGKINMGSTQPTNEANYNKTVRSDAAFNQPLTDLPDSIVFWAKFKPNGGTSDLARMNAMIHDDYDYRDPQDASSANHVVGRAEVDYPSTGNKWVRKAVAFDYSGPATGAKYILVTFTTNKTPGGGNKSDQVWIDDVELIYIPKASFTKDLTLVCKGSSVNFTSTSTNFATDYHWSFPGGTPATSTDQNPTVTYNTAGTYDVTLIASNQWGNNTITHSDYITVNSIDASFNYGSTNFICSSGGNQTPNVTEAGGTFVVNSSGLTLDVTTGEIDVPLSTEGNYEITYTVSGVCKDSSTLNIILSDIPNAEFSYDAATFCLNDINPSPVFATGNSSGEFSSSNGLSIDNNSGTINLFASDPGIYTVENSIVADGGCPSASYTFDIEINNIPTVDLILPFDTICTNVSTVTLSGGDPQGGVYSGTGVTGTEFDITSFSSGDEAKITYTVTDNITNCSNSATETIVIDACLNVKELNPLKAISVYPNPTEGILTINKVQQKTQYSVSTVLGQVVKSGELTEITNAINIQSLRKGTYFISFQQGDNFSTQRIIKL